MSTTKMRQALDELRPWNDERAVASALREWMATSLHRRENGVREPLRLGDEVERDAAAKIAAALYDLGRVAPRMNASEVVGAVGFMLRNIAAGREATDYGDAFEHFSGDGVPSAQTRRRYRRAYGERAGWQWMGDKLQYRLDLVGLVKGGRSEAAARRWLQRNPGKHAADAPPPRRRAA